MILKNYTWDYLNNYNHGKKLCFFGTGRLLERFLRSHENPQIDLFIDNSNEKQGKYYVVNEKEIPIISVEEFSKKNVTMYIMVIAVLNVAEIYSQIEKFETMKDMECCILVFLMDMENNELENKRFYPSDYRILTKPVIPKRIHYCWFGKSAIPEKNRIWMESWKKYCPDYEIIEWNEDNYDINKNKFMRQAYEAKKWGFVPDYARLDIIYCNGGIYLDTDVELLKPLDDLLYQEAFCGIDESKCVSLGLGFGARKNNGMIGELRELYDNIKFDVNKMVAAPAMQKQYFANKGYKTNGDYQIIGDMTIYPEKVLSGKSNITGIIRSTEHTYAVHHYDASWVDEKRLYNISKRQELYWELNN